MAAQISSALKSRIARPSFLSKVMSPQDTVQFFHNGQAIGWSGFSPAGYPKVVPLAVADYVEKHNLQGKMRFDVFCGASTGVEVEDRWAALGLTRRRTPYISGDHIRKGVNTGKIQFKDTHLSNFAGALAYGHFSKQQVHTDEGGVDREFLAEANEPIEEEDHHEISAKSPAELVELWRQKKLEMEQKKNQKNISYPKQTIRTGGLDIGIIECTEILENGGLILGSGIGIAPEMAAKADKIILEVNTALPSFFGLHDNVSNDVPPFRKPYMIQRVDDRIGTPYLPIDPDKVVAVVESNMLDNGNKLEAPDAISRRIAGHLMDFFEHEVKVGRLPPQLLPLQSGVGNIANAVMAGLANGPFFNVRIWTEVLQDTVLDFFDSGRLEFASTAALSLSPQGFSRFYKNWDEYASKIVIRPQHISNHPEIVRRLGVIAMNTPVEVDIYAHANSTMVGGTKMVHGIGGSGDFIRNGYIPIMHTPSARATKNDPTGISCIVPKCSHIDHTEHDIYIVVTEQGLADLRGMSPRNRAVELIKKCAHPDYKDQLMDYFRYAEKVCLAQGAGHEPQILRLAFKMYENLEKKGSMKVDKWE